MLEGLGFKALATTSSGLAFTHGRLDGGATADDVFAHVREVTQATALPLSVDLENGYGAAPEQAAAAIVGAAEAGAVGGSIEDWDPDTGIYPLAQAVERVQAACEAAHALDFPFTVTARAENLIRGISNLDDTIERLLAFEQAGADVLFAPGLRTPDEIRTVCAATSKPVNVLAHAKLTMAEIVDAGAQRVSVGGALTWTAVNAMVAAAERLRDDGDFSVLGSGARIRELFGA